MRWLIVLLVLFAGCITEKKVNTSEGDIAHAIECKGRHSWADCYERAGEICPYGYEVVEKETEFNKTQEIKTLIIRCE